jgi:hypothetical protein
VVVANQASDWAQVAVTALIGALTVFVALSILWGALTRFRARVCSDSVESAPVPPDDGHVVATIKL